MRIRYILIIISAICLSANCETYAQRSLLKRIEFDFGHGGNSSLINRYSSTDANKFFRTSHFKFNTSISIPISNRGWGVWGEYDIRITNAYKERDDDMMRVNALGPQLNLDNYYRMSDLRYEDSGPTFVLNIGAYRRFVFNRWAIDARLGAGYLMQSSQLDYSFTVKEKNTNNIYHVNMTDARLNDFESAIISGGVKVNYYFGRKKRIFLGSTLSYIQNLKRHKLYYIYREEVSNEIIEQKTIKGRLQGSIDYSFRMGFSF